MLKLDDKFFLQFVVNDGHLKWAGFVRQKVSVVRTLQVKLHVCKEMSFKGKTRPQRAQMQNDFCDFQVLICARCGFRKCLETSVDVSGQGESRSAVYCIQMSFGLKFSQRFK